MSIYDTEDSVEKSFDEDFIPEEQLQTQWAEFIEFKKVIHELTFSSNKTLSILDIGIGTARIVKHLSGIKEIWDKISHYHGIDNSDSCLSISKKVIQELKIEKKVSVSLLEADQLFTLNANYDLIITTWFTPGNFYPLNFPFETYKNSNDKIDLTENPRFQKIFYKAYQLLNIGGSLLLGSCYIDNDANRIKQEYFYKKLGMEIITDAKDSFTATKQGFWSQRFTKEKLKRYFNFVSPDKIIFTPLDTYNFALQVRIQK
ncbi:MAG: hypothetical protein NVS9B7_15370 [Flavisolibacter sp.]